MIKHAGDFESPLRKFVDELNQEFYRINREINYEGEHSESFVLHRRVKVLEAVFDAMEQRLDRLEELFRVRSGFDDIEAVQKESPALENAGESPSKEQ